MYMVWRVAGGLPGFVAHNKRVLAPGRVLCYACSGRWDRLHICFGMKGCTMPPVLFGRALAS